MILIAHFLEFIIKWKSFCRVDQMSKQTQAHWSIIRPVRVTLSQAVPGKYHHDGGRQRQSGAGRCGRSHRGLHQGCLQVPASQWHWGEDGVQIHHQVPIWIRWPVCFHRGKWISWSIIIAKFIFFRENCICLTKSLNQMLHKIKCMTRLQKISSKVTPETEEV